MKLLWLIACLPLARAQTVSDNLKAIRDDLRGICYKAYGGADQGKMHCRDVQDADSQRHVHHECWKSGWSGRGNLRCKYGFDMHGANMQGAGDQAVHRGAHGGAGRRRLGEADGLGSGLSEEEREFIEEEEHEMASTGDKQVDFEFENLDDKDVMYPLDGHSIQEALCIMTEVEIHSAEGVNPGCGVTLGADGLWNMRVKSAKCKAYCMAH